MSEFYKNIENKIENREKGYNVVHSIRVLRHPEKSQFDSEITEKGAQDAAHMGKVYARWKKIYGEKVGLGSLVHSGHKRPKAAAEKLVEGMGEPTFPIIEDPGFSFVGSEEFDEGYKKALGDAEEDFRDETAGVQYIVDTNETPFDSESYSSKDISRAIARSLLKLIEKNDETESNKHIRSLVFSHSGVLENFLVDLLEVRGEKESVKKIGGGLSFLEGFQLKVVQKTPNERHVEISFIPARSGDIDYKKTAERLESYSKTISFDELAQLAK